MKRHMKRFAFLALGLSALVCVADTEHPDLWFCGISLNNNYSVNIANQVVTEDGVITNWQDGAILHIGPKSTSTTYFPQAVQDAVLAQAPARGVGVIDNSYVRFTTDTSVHKLCYKSGGRWIGGNGKLTLGAGGFDGTSSWDTYNVQIAGGICLGASQPWLLNDGNVKIDSTCKLTSAAGVIWTISSSKAKTLSVCSVSELTGADIVLTNSVRLSLAAETAALNAETLTIAWAGTSESVILFDASLRTPRLDRAFAKQVILKGNVQLGTNQTFNGVVIDLDNLVVMDGDAGLDAVIGTGCAYSIKDGGDQLLSVSNGASVVLATLPTNGTFKVAGAGTLKTTATQMKQLKFENFTGKLVLTDGTLSYLQLPSGCTPSSYEISGSTILALPATGDWPAGMTVTTAGSALLYLPAGSSVDTAKILGTANYSATARGIVAEAAGSVTVASGETLVIAGDGFGTDTAIAMNGGTLSFPISAMVASPITVGSDSLISVDPVHTVLLTGALTVNAALDVATTPASSPLNNMGLLVFAGGGSATHGIHCHYGRMEFRGGTWAFAAGMSVLADTQCRRIAFTEGVKATFAAGDNTDLLRKGIQIGSAASYPGTLEISGGAEVTLNNFRMLRLGDTSWGNDATMIVDGATLNVLGYEGEFDIGSLAKENLRNTSADRCPRVKIYVRNGGVIETDRVLSSPPITHKVDGGTELEGLHLTLDGGTYRLGTLFGAREPYPRQHPNQLFGGADAMNVSRSYTLDHTCEIEVTVGEKGATFDLSKTRPECTSFTNTVANLPLEGANTEYFPSGYYPCLGPRWIVNGALNVKGNGNQEFVINGLDPAAVTTIGADGVKVKIVGANSAALEEMTLGAAGAGLSVETEAGAGRNVSIGTLKIAENGVCDLDELVSATIGDIIFGENATFVLPATPVAVGGKVTLATSMKYFAYSGRATGGSVLTATGGIEPSGGEGVTWERAEGSQKRILIVRANDLVVTLDGTIVLFR